jgi:hypothetical protein
VLAGGHLDIGVAVEEEKQGVLAIDGAGDAFDASGDRGHLVEGFQTFRLKRYFQRSTSESRRRSVLLASKGV